MPEDESSWRDHAKEAAVAYPEHLKEVFRRAEQARKQRCAEQLEHDRWRELATGVCQALRAHGIHPRIKAVPEITDCNFSWTTGAVDCKHLNYKPALDCREPFCPHAVTMRTRHYKRLVARYAPGVKPREGQ